MRPILLARAKRVHHVSMVVRGVCQYLRRVRHAVSITRRHLLAVRRTQSDRGLNRVDLLERTAQADELWVEVREPLTHSFRRVSLRIGRNEHNLDLICYVRREFFQHRADVRHVQGTYVRTVRVPEEQQRHEFLCFFEKRVIAALHRLEREIDFWKRLLED